MAAMKHVIEADLTDKTYVTVSGLWQWDYGQILRIIGLELDASEFSVEERKRIHLRLGICQRQRIRVYHPKY